MYYFPWMFADGCTPFIYKFISSNISQVSIYIYNNSTSFSSIFSNTVNLKKRDDKTSFPKSLSTVCIYILARRGARAREYTHRVEIRVWGARLLRICLREVVDARFEETFFSFECLPTYRLVIIGKKKNDGTFDTQLRYARRAQQWARGVLRETLHCHALRLMEPRLIDNALALFSPSLSFLSFFLF